MKIIVSGGGTGGHIFPGISLIKYIKKREHDADFLWIGAKNRMETKIVPNEGIKIATIEISGFERGFKIGSILKNAKNFARLITMTSFIQTYKTIMKFKPDLIIGAGGYVCFPVIMTGYLMGKACYLLEQNAIPGSTNIILSGFVRKIFGAFPDASKYFKKKNKFIVTGNPVREEILLGTREDGIRQFGLDEKKKTIFIIGGSLGSKAINDAAVEAYDILSRTEGLREKIQIIHSTGERYYKEIRERTNGTNLDIRIAGFIKEMDKVISCTDIAVCRGGAIALSELVAKGVYVIVIPWKHSTKNHQERNAEFIEKNNAGKMIRDDDLNAKILAQEIIRVIGNESITNAAKASCKNLNIYKGNENIYGILKNEIQ